MLRRHARGDGGFADRRRRSPSLRGRPGGVMFPKIISVDDHVVEPADVWQKRLPEKYLDVGPRVVRAPLGEMTFVGGNFSYSKGEGRPCDWWHYEDKKIPQTRLSAAVGFDRDEVKIT